MRVHSVTAYAFGPLAGQTLTFADGLTVVYGANESAKSTWHAAIFAALCGRRRGRAPNVDERRFAELRKPWDGDEWRVGAQVLLDDGRLVEIHQDLAGRVDCEVRDLELGKDISAEFLYDGAPDVTRSLGLDRNTFRATACIAQAQVLAVQTNAGSLQEQLQRAATAADADQTAAAALERIDEFRREQVGSERVGNRPLRRALAGVDAARLALSEGRAAHADYQSRLIELDQLRAAAVAAEHRLAVQRAAALARTAGQLRQIADEATELHRRLDGGPPPSLSADEALAEQVAAALAAWQASPVQPVNGSGSATEPPQTGSAAGSGARAGDDPLVDSLTEAQLWELARVLAMPAATLDPEPARRVDLARQRLAAVEQGHRRGRWLLAAAATVAVAGTAFQLAGGSDGLDIWRPGYAAWAPVAVAGALALLSAFAGWLLIRSRPLVPARDEVTSALAAEAAARGELERSRSQRAAAESSAARLGLPADPETLRGLARARAGKAVAEARDQQWQAGVEESRRRITEQVLAAVAATGKRLDDPAEAAAALRAWQSHRTERLAAQDVARRDWARLQSLLAGDDLAQLQQRAATAAAHAEQAAVNVAASDLAAVGAADEASLEGMRAQARTAQLAVAEAEGQLNVLAARLVPVGELEEEQVRAEAELARVRELDQTLALTRGFLAAAQERAYRGIAPVLVQTVRAWLPQVTAGRYTEVTVDPEKLRVDVRGPSGRWRDAGRLSHGTAEQIYLLLRIALATHLVRPGTTCPLLLDDVTVHADRQRTEQVLDLLLAVAAQRQVIMFTQQEDVIAWARQRLTEPGHAIRELAPLTAS
ncbi:MAG TPA: AAA family ATPase [Micromonosporaceae bacterium]